MKTLVFCTAFASTPDLWRYRYRSWVDALHASNLEFDQILIVDDGSDTTPDWPDLTVISERSIGEAENLINNAPLLFYQFEKNLGKKDIFDVPGWYRSFSFSARYAEAQNFDKVVHIESDAFLISHRIVDYVNQLSDGWTTFWCPSYDFPEMAIQIIAGNEIKNFARFFRQPYYHLIGTPHELKLPYTNVVRSFIGDRLGNTPTKYHTRQTTRPRLILPTNRTAGGFRVTRSKKKS